VMRVAKIDMHLHKAMIEHMQMRWCS